MRLVQLRNGFSDIKFTNTHNVFTVSVGYRSVKEWAETMATTTNANSKGKDSGDR